MLYTKAFLKIIPLGYKQRLFCDFYLAVCTVHCEGMLEVHRLILQHGDSKGSSHLCFCSIKSQLQTL